MGIKHIQLPVTSSHPRIPLPPTYRCPPTTYNRHHQTRGHKSHTIATATHVGTKHIQLSPPYTWVPTISNRYRHTRGPPTTHNCRSHTRWHKPHPTGTTKLVGPNHIQLPQPHTRAPTISIWLHQTRGYQSHPIHMATHLDIKHIQLLQPHTRAPTTYNRHHQTRGHKSHPIATATHVGTKHIQLSPPYTWASTISNRYRHTRGTPTTHNCHSHTRWHKQHPIGITKLVGTIHIHLTWTHTWASNTSNCQSYLATHEFQLPPPYTWTPTASI